MPRFQTFEFATERGIFCVRHVNGRWRAMFEDEELGAYADPLAAAYELANGLTFWPSFGDPSRLGIPEALEDWEIAS